MKNKKKNKIKLFAIYLILPLFMLVTVSFAWFFINQQVELDYEPNIQCEAGHSLEISIDDEQTWAGAAKLTGDIPKMLDITGDGQNLYKPITIDENLVPQGFEKAEAIDPISGEVNFIEIQVKLRTNSKMNVYLSADSFVQPVNLGTATNSIFGSFSRNYIAGAVRVYVGEIVNGKEEPRMLWDPNPYYKLVRNQNGTYNFYGKGFTNEFDFSKDGYEDFPTYVDVDAKNGTSNYKYYVEKDNEYSTTNITIDDIAKKKLSLGKVGGTNELMAGDSPILTSFDPAVDKASEQELMKKSLVIRVWFEGTDREADQALSGGEIKMYFKFNGVNKAAALETNQNAINAITYSGGRFNHLQNGFEYSNDGFHWIKYTGQNLYPTSYKHWYWRYPETENNLASNYVHFSN